MAGKSLSKSILFGVSQSRKYKARSFIPDAYFVDDVIVSFHRAENGRNVPAM